MTSADENISAIIVTRGDVEIQQIIDSLPSTWEVVIWDNGERRVSRSDGFAEVCSDFSVYGRYAAIEYASRELIYVQDDDVLVSDPDALVIAWCAAVAAGDDDFDDVVVCNMPPEFRHEFYEDHALVGFGAIFHRDAPFRAFARWVDDRPGPSTIEDRDAFLRTCDVIFTTIVPTRVLVDVPKTNLPWAEDFSRMYRQPNHTTERLWALQLARRARDA